MNPPNLHFHSTAAFGANFLQLQEATLGTMSRLLNDPVRPSLSLCFIWRRAHGFVGPAAAFGASFLQLQKATLGTA